MLFRSHEGIFLVDSDFRQFSLDFKDKWPVAKNMNAHIIFKNRDLIADINDGMLDQLPLTDIKAQIPALGLGTETLKIEGHLKADASHARHFILNSPIEEKLSSFNNLLLSGPGIFDVDIQIPLYAKNNINLVNGKVMFLDNTLTLEKWWNTNIQHFKGNLSYNQNGVISSQLDGKFFNYPLHLTMKSVVKPTSATVVDINAQLGIDELRQMFPI